MHLPIGDHVDNYEVTAITRTIANFRLRIRDIDNICLIVSLTALNELLLNELFLL